MPYLNPGQYPSKHHPDEQPFAVPLDMVQGLLILHKAPRYGDIPEAWEYRLTCQCCDGKLEHGDFCWPVDGGGRQLLPRGVACAECFVTAVQFIERAAKEIREEMGALREIFNIINRAEKAHTN